MKHNNQEFKKILIIGCRLIGDAVLTLPGIRAIGNAFTDAVIDVLSTKTTEEIYTNPDFVHDFIPYSQNYPVKKQLQTIRKLRSNKYDIAILYSGSFNAALIAFLSGIKKKIGIVSDYRSFLLSDKVKIKSPDIHQRDIYKKITGLINVDVDDNPICYVVDSKSKNDVVTMIKKDKLKKGEFIVINPTASEKNKIWPGFAEWIKQYVSVKNNKVILVGAKADKAVCEKLVKESGSLSVYNWAGKLKVRQTAALLSMAKFYLGNNSGIMHLAAAVGCRVFAVSGHSNLKKTRPFTEFHSIVYTDIFCRPCFNKKLKKCRHAACINSIKTEDVSRMIEKGNNVVVKPDTALLNKRWIRKQKKYRTESGKIFIINSSKTHCGVDDYCLFLYELFNKSMDFTFFAAENSDFLKILKKRKLEYITMPNGHLSKYMMFSSLIKKTNPEFIHIQTAKDYFLIPVFYKKANVIITRHNSFKLNYLTNKFVLKKADSIITLSDFSRSVLVNQFPFLKNKVQIIYNSIDNNLCKSIDKPPIKIKNHKKSSSDLRIGFIGRINPLKGLDKLVESLGLLKEKLNTDKFVLKVAGNFEDERYRKEVEDIAIHYKIFEKIEFMGFLKSKIDFYSNIDILAIPSRLAWKETCPLVAFESMCFSIPIVSFSSGSMSEIVIDGYSGYVCKNESIYEMAESFYKFYEDRKLLKKMGKNSNKLFNEKFSSEIFVNKMRELYLKNEK